jgi:hypothetical protein
MQGHETKYHQEELSLYYPKVFDKIKEDHIFSFDFMQSSVDIINLNKI